MSKKYYEYNKMVWANQVSYKTSIARDHHIDALVGYEIDDQYRDYLSGYATNFATHDKYHFVVFIILLAHTPVDIIAVGSTRVTPVFTFRNYIKSVMV